MEFGDTWPPLPPLDPRQAFKDEEEKVDVGVVAAVVAVAASSTLRSPGRPKGSKNLPCTALIEQTTTSGPEFGHSSIKTLRMRRQ